jgi:hypothetical protein
MNYQAYLGLLEIVAKMPPTVLGKTLRPSRLRNAYPASVDYGSIAMRRACGADETVEFLFPDVAEPRCFFPQRGSIGVRRARLPPWRLLEPAQAKSSVRNAGQPWT